MDNNKNKTALITGATGFIGFHLSKRLLDQGWRVVRRALHSLKEFNWSLVG